MEAAARSCRLRPAAAGDEVARDIRGFLQTLLSEVELPAEITDIDSVSERAYIVWLSIPGEPAKSIRLSRVLVREALTGWEARHHVLVRLRSAVAKLYSQRAVDSARETRALGRQGRLCTDCGRPIPPNAAVAFLHGQLFHLACYERPSPPPA